MEYTKGERCSAQSYDPSGWGRYHPCTRKAVVERGGKPYCKIHDPEYVKAKDEARTAKFDAEMTKKRIVWERRALLASIFEGIETKDIEANIGKYKSAPDLYEALKAIVLEGTQCCNNPDRPIREIYNIDMVDRIARKALAKAES